MSVFAVVGLPGSGKTYSVVEHQIFPALRARRTVVTNVPLKWDLVRGEYPGCDLRQVNIETWVAEPERVGEECPPGAVIVLDEVWRLWPAGARADRIPEAFRSFLAEHRHRVDASGDSQQIVLVTQDLKQIAAFARQQVEQTFRCVKLTAVGLSRRFRVDIFQGPAEGPNPPVSARLRQLFGRYDKRVFGFYVSHTMSESSEEGANEAAVDRRGNVLMRPLVLLSPVLVVLLVLGGIYGLRHGGVTGRGMLGVRAANAAGRVPGGGGGFLGRRGDGRARSVARVGGWRLTARFAGLCWSGGCGWALLEDGSREAWVQLLSCRQVGPGWRCPAPGGGWASDAFAPARPSLADRSSVRVGLER